MVCGTRMLTNQKGTAGRGTPRPAVSCTDWEKQNTSFCERGNEPLASIRDRYFLSQLSNCHILKNNCSTQLEGRALGALTLVTCSQADRLIGWQACCRFKVRTVDPSVGPSVRPSLLEYLSTTTPWRILITFCVASPSSTLFADCVAETLSFKIHFNVILSSSLRLKLSRGCHRQKRPRSFRVSRVLAVSTIRRRLCDFRWIPTCVLSHRWTSSPFSNFRWSDPRLFCTRHPN